MPNKKPDNKNKKFYLHNYEDICVKVNKTLFKQSVRHNTLHLLETEPC